MIRDEVIEKWETLPPRERDAWIGEKIMGILEYNKERTKAAVDECLAMHTFKDGVQERFQKGDDGWRRERGEGDRWFTRVLPHLWRLVGECAERRCLAALIAVEA